MARPPNTEAVLWSRVEPSGDCLVWAGPLNRYGYGIIPWNRKLRTVHRLVMEILVGPLSDDTAVCHHCDNRKCLRPDHLFLGSVAENSRDCVKKQRHAFGERNRGGTKLTDQQVRAMRAEHAAGIGSRKLAKRYGTSVTSAWRVITNQSWKHVE